MYELNKKCDLNESKNNKTLVCIDIQPAYEKLIKFPIDDFISFLNNSNYEKIYYFFNGPELGYEDVNEIQDWLTEYGLSEDILNIIEFEEKDYGWFRELIDSNKFNINDITKLVSFMYNNNIKQSADITDNQWQNLNLSKTTKSKLINIIEDNLIVIPQIDKILQNISQCDIIGGGKNECLLEVQILMSAMKIKYNPIDNFIY